MNKKQLVEFLRFSSPDYIYIVTWYNKLLKLDCPFQVQLKHDIGELLKGDIVYVDKVKLTVELKTVFVVKNKAYYYHHFQILIDD